MGHLARGAESRRAGSTHLIALACAVATLALPVAAPAKPPAANQYKVPNPSATGSDGGTAGSRPAPPTASSDGGSGDAAVPILIGGLAVIGAAGAVALYRRSRTATPPPE
jgi:hypothetical protein